MSDHGVMTTPIFDELLSELSLDLGDANVLDEPAGSGDVPMG